MSDSPLPPLRQEVQNYLRSCEHRLHLAPVRIEPMDRARPAHLPSWVIVLGMAIGMAGCTSLESSREPGMVNISTRYQTSYQWLSQQLGIVDADTRVAPLSPTETVKGTINEMLIILGDERLRQPGLSQDRRQQIEHVIRHHVDSKQMAQRSLGAPWSTLTVPKQQEFENLFVELLRDLVANKIDHYYDTQVLYLAEQREGSFGEVRTQLIGTKVDTSVDFRLEHHSGDWLMYDMVIDGASVVGNYRTQFGRIIRDQAYAGLVEKMKQRANSVKMFEKTAPASEDLTMNMDHSR